MGVLLQGKKVDGFYLRPPLEAIERCTPPAATNAGEHRVNATTLASLTRVEKRKAKRAIPVSLEPVINDGTFQRSRAGMDTKPSPDASD
jgi:hypothetical protein